MGILDRWFPENDARHDHEHFPCPACGQEFHDRNELEFHKTKAHRE